MIHEKASVRGTWAPHAVDGWYLGPAEHHYRCYRVYAKETSAERVADTVVWFPQHVRLPVASSTDAAIEAARALTHALLHPTPASPLSAISDYHRDALTRLADIFADATAPPPAPTPNVGTQLPPPGFAALPPLVVVPLPRVASIPPVTAPPLPRVVIPTTATQIPAGAPTQQTPADNLLADTTYTAVTGNAGRRRRQAAARARHQPPPAPVTVLPHNTRNRATRRGIMPSANTATTTPRMTTAPLNDAHFACCTVRSLCRHDHRRGSAGRRRTEPPD